MRERISRHSGTAALVISIVALVGSTTGLASAARHAIVSAIAGHQISAKPTRNGLLLLGHNKKFPAAAIPTVGNANHLGGKSLASVEPSCQPTTVNIGTWCLMTAFYPLTNQQAGMNNYFWASQACVNMGGYLPTAAQLIGAAARVKLAGTIHESQLTSSISLDPSVGLKDLREMSATLVTTAAGSDAAGSEGVSVGATGDPRTGEPNPVPLPAVPAPSTLQYVTVYSNGTKGGFAGSEPVSQPENFRCAFNKAPGANSAAAG
ncbi:MAG TPA: hypothetical protein VFR48_11110 [Solirubrobacteraceae bacterium]|nr:hypothetical protein [Solirubrobacteraceae bacterium]